MKSAFASLLLLLVVIGVTSSTADDNVSNHDIRDAGEDSEIGRILGYNMMNTKKSSRKYWRGVYDDCCKGSKKRIRKNCDCPVRFVGRWKKKWNRSCKTTIKDRAGK